MEPVGKFPGVGDVGHEEQVVGGRAVALNGREQEFDPQAMGLTKVTTRLVNLTKPRKFYGRVFLVDMGATDSMAPADEMGKLGMAKRVVILLRMGKEYRRETGIAIGKQKCPRWERLRFLRSFSGDKP